MPWFDGMDMSVLIALKDSAESTDILNKEKFLKSIRILDLSGFGLLEIPEFIKEMSGLKDLNLADNRISGNISFADFPLSLEGLDLSGNQIESVSFTGANSLLLSSLIRLDLTANLLTTFPDKLNLCVELRFLSLASNKIRKVDKSCKVPAKIEKLVLADNQISEVTYYTGGITRAISIDLTENKLREFPSKMIMGRLRHLILTNNPIEDWGFIERAMQKGVTVT